MASIAFSEPAREPESGIFFRKTCNTSTPKARLMLLHGIGSNEANLISLAASLPEDLEILLLRGPLQVGPQGFAWYQVTFTNNGPSFNYVQAEASRKLLQSFINAQSKLPTVIAGFSQGGIMSSSLGLTEPELVKGFALLSGRMLREIEPQIASTERLQSTSAFIAHGQRDDVLPIDWAKEADAWLDRIGVAHETHFYDMAHEMVAEELADFSQWLTKTLSLTN
ncbi:phospholipase/carboxylesterase [Pseudomonas duriflava]|uniref:Phospholipase/carboxylesterase n=1 Tax=Pseudomonas duriflava TaxID=459528 RepID=A0A562PVY5_9PSED|nr:phospholipase [Pseudomonas duriflava]TWI48246.1 phospholipase/carboxylesterase [Pseudomonas duriflava]